MICTFAGIVTEASWPPLSKRYFNTQPKAKQRREDQGKHGHLGAKYGHLGAKYGHLGAANPEVNMKGKEHGKLGEEFGELGAADPRKNLLGAWRTNGARDGEEWCFWCGGEFGSCD